MEEQAILLHYDPEIFREIYYDKGRDSVLNHAPTKSSITNTILALVFNMILYFLSLKYNSISWLLVLGIIGLIFIAGYSIVQIIKFTKWKKSVERFIKDLSQHKFFELRLTDNAIKLIMDEDITIDKWETIKSVKIEEKYIQLDKETGLFYLFPAKSMTIEEFVTLKDFVMLKFK